MLTVWSSPKSSHLSRKTGNNSMNRVIRCNFLNYILRIRSIPYQNIRFTSFHVLGLSFPTFFTTYLKVKMLSKRVFLWTSTDWLFILMNKFRAMRRTLNPLSKFSSNLLTPTAVKPLKKSWAADFSADEKFTLQPTIKLLLICGTILPD